MLHYNWTLQREKFYFKKKFQVNTNRWRIYVKLKYGNEEMKKIRKKQKTSQHHKKSIIV
jgi:hypothetical protein